MEQLREIIYVNKALSHPTRLAIMLILAIKGRAVFSDLQKLLGLTPGNLDSHLRKLQAAGYITVRKAFVGLSPRTVVEITPLGLRETLSYASTLRSSIEQVLSSVKSSSA